MRDQIIVVLGKLANAFEILAIAGILTLALIFEFVFHELPCPLCLLQRVGFYFMVFGFLLNLRFGLKPSHYSIVILGGFYTAFVALRQIALHVIPGTGAYGDPIFGLHLYTWSFIITLVIIIATTLIMSINRQFSPKAERKKSLHWLTQALFIFVILTLVINIISVILLCGFVTCPDSPVKFVY